MREKIFPLIIISLILSLSIISAIGGLEDNNSKELSFWQRIINWFSKVFKNAEVKKDLYERVSLEKASLSHYEQICLDEINHKIKVAEAKTNLIDYSIKEYKVFNETTDALMYLGSWEYEKIEFPSLYTKKQTYEEVWIDGYPRSKFGWNETIYEYDGVVVVLVNRRISFGRENIKSMYPVICVNGKITENSKVIF